jgi:hypothetical protein
VRPRERARTPAFVRRPLLCNSRLRAAWGPTKADNHFATHKWYAILVSLTSGFEGTKATIQKSFVCKQHFERAIALNPQDATSRHLLGLWCVRPPLPRPRPLPPPFLVPRRDPLRAAALQVLRGGGALVDDAQGRRRHLRRPAAAAAPPR